MKYKFVLLVIIISSISHSLFAEWVNITRQESQVLIGDNFPTEQSNLTFQNKTDVKNNVVWHWVYGGSDPYIEISWYRLPTDWYVYKGNVYLPRKQIDWLVGEGKWEWTGKRKGFKSLKMLSNYRTFKKKNENCFIFGVHFTLAYAGYTDEQSPYAVLEGYACQRNEFSKNEIENIINNIGIKELRKL